MPGFHGNGTRRPPRPLRHSVRLVRLEEKGHGQRCVAAEPLLPLRPQAPEDLRPTPLPGKRKPGSASEIPTETRAPRGGAHDKRGAMSSSPVFRRGRRMRFVTEDPRDPGGRLPPAVTAAGAWPQPQCRPGPLRPRVPGGSPGSVLRAV